MAGEAMSAYVRFFVRDEVSSEVRNVEQAAERAADGMDEAADAAGNRMSASFDKAKTSAGNLAKGAAAVGAGAAALIGGMVGLANETAEFQEDMGKLQTAFETNGHTMETANAVYKDFVGLVGETDQAVEASNHLATLTSSTEELSAWGDIAAGVYSRFGDSLPIEGLTEAANETAKVGVVTGPLADALNWAGIKEDEFNEKLAKCNTEAERATLITQTLNGEYGKAGQAYQKNNADLIAQRQAQSDFNAAMTELGNVIRPLVVDVMNFGSTLLTAVKPHLEWVITNLPTIAPIVAGIVTAFLSFHAVSAAVAAVSGAITLLRNGTLLMTAAQAALNVVMNLNPFVLVATLILGLVAAFITAYKTNDTFRKKVDAAFKAIKTAVSGAVNTVKSVVSGMVSSLSSAFESVRSKAASIFAAVKNAIVTPINTARDAIRTAMNTIKSIVNGLKLELPRFKLPHFIISGGEIPWGIGGKGTKPTIDVQWYAKGAIFDAPTIFATQSGFKGVGEAGPEAVAPISKLMDYVRLAVAEAGGAGGFVSNITVNTGETSEAKLAKLIAREEKRQAYAMGVI